jgi:hypothetical protein
VDSRKLYLAQAYPSLFEWVRKVLPSWLACSFQIKLLNI